MSALSACFPPQVVLCLLKLILGQEDKTISFGDDIVVHVHPQHCFMLLKILRKMFFFVVFLPLQHLGPFIGMKKIPGSYLQTIFLRVLYFRPFIS